VNPPTVVIDRPRSTAVHEPVPGDGLLHPIVLLAIGILLINDHVLKSAWPGAVTGKLSDIAGLVFFPLLVQEIGRLISTINRERGVPVVLVEQNAALALELARYAYVLETGTVALEGPAADLRTNDHVRRAYLGG
jgi:hypothetical protein